jgi:putative isomerase
MLQYFYKPEKFWGERMVPTVPYDDPEWTKQHYWKGHVWAPANWLVWQGFKRYADPKHRAEFARRSVRLFMHHWNEGRQCYENCRCDIAKGGAHPNYTWGALLNLIAIEALCDVDENLNPVPNPNSGITENLTLRNIPYGGKLYRIEARGGKVTVSLMSEPGRQ